MAKLQHKFSVEEIGTILEMYPSNSYEEIAEETGLTNVQVAYVVGRARQDFAIPKKAKKAYLTELIKLAVVQKKLDYAPIKK